MILEKFRSKLVEYAKAQDKERLEVLRFFLAQIKNKEIELRPQGIEVNDEHAYKVVKKLLKQVNETIDTCEKAGRAEALAKAKTEKAILEEFMEEFPAELKNA